MNTPQDRVRRHLNPTIEDIVGRFAAIVQEKTGLKIRQLELDKLAKKTLSNVDPATIAVRVEALANAEENSAELLSLVEILINNDTAFFSSSTAVFPAQQTA